MKRKKKLVKAQDIERDAQYIGTKSVISPIFIYFFNILAIKLYMFLPKKHLKPLGKKIKLLYYE